MKGLLNFPDDASGPISQNTKRYRGWNNSILAAAVTTALLYFYLASPSGHPRNYCRQKDSFHWKQCSNDTHYLCGFLTVPLDYTNASDPRTVDIATTLYQQRPGKKTTRTLIIEPGGPGGSGTSMLWEKGRRFGEMYTGDQLDVLGFDPRGVNLSSPAMSCFPHDAFRDRWEWVRTTWPESIGHTAIDTLDAMSEAIMRACREKWGDIPRFLTTSLVARDVDAIREALGEEKLTGFMVSYGTGIGQTYAQMFPDRIGALVLDGMEYVRDGWEAWSWGTSSLDNVTDAFEDGFIGECVKAGSTGCALAHQSQSPVTDDDDDDFPNARSALSKRVHAIFNSTLHRPIPGTSSLGPGIVKYEHLVEWLYATMYHPQDWKEAATILAELEKGNATLALEGIHKLSWSYDPRERMHGDEVFPKHYSHRHPRSAELEDMVICGDAYDAENKSLEWWKHLHGEMIQKSWISGTPTFFATLPCRHYDWEPAEVYRGNFSNPLNRPILLIGSPYDPATPLRNARRLLDEMGDNARLIVHGGYGHSSARDISSCTNANVRAYIMDGTVPEDKETHCGPDGKPFDVGFMGF